MKNVISKSPEKSNSKLTKHNYTLFLKLLSALIPPFCKINQILLLPITIDKLSIECTIH